MKPCPICHVDIADWKLMCKVHFPMIPKPLQEAVNHFNRHRKGGPSHLRACRQAIEAVTSTLEARQREIDAKAPKKSEPKPTSLPYRDD